MSLIFWFPLNNNINNQATGNFSVVTKSAPEYANGKVTYNAFNGKGNNYIRINNPLIGLDSWTIAFWFNKNSSATWSDLISFTGDAQRLEYTIAGLYWYNGAAGVSADHPFRAPRETFGKFWPSASIITNITNNKWYHITLVFNNNTSKIYLHNENGELITAQTKENTKKFIHETETTDPNFVDKIYFNCRVIPSASYTWSTGNYTASILNDIRIYDEALSEYEIKELSKGLCVHYSFDEYLTTTTLLPKYINVNTYLGNDFTIDSNGDLINQNTDTASTFAIQFQALNSAGDHRNLSGGLALTETDEDYSFKFTIPTDCIKMRIKHNGENSDLNIISPNMPVTGNKSYAVSFKLINNNPQSVNGIRIRNFKIVELPDIYDASGYKHNAIVKLNTNAETAIYTHARPELDSITNAPVCVEDISPYIFKNTLKLADFKTDTFCYLKLSIVPSFINSGTVSIWYKATTPNQSFILTDCNNNAGWLFASSNLGSSRNSGATYTKLYIDGKLIENDTSTDQTPTDTNWHHYCVTGVDLTSCTSLQLSARDSAWTYKGNIADYRIYSTALSTDDVLDLYNNSIIIDNNQQVFLTNITETSDLSTQLQISKKHIKTPEIIEGRPENYDNLYRPAEYIEATGTQYIKTDVIGQAIWEYDIEYDPNHITQRQLMGHGGSGGEYWGITNGKWGKATWQTSDVPVNRERVIYRVNNYSTAIQNGGNVYVNDTYIYNNGYDAVSEQKQANIFNIGNSFYNYCKLYGCKVYTIDNTLIRNFIPVIRIFDNKPGLYDLIGHKFYFNQGTGEFLADGIPTEYSHVECIESDGNQYIDTGYGNGNGFYAEIDFKLKVLPPEITGGSYGYVIGCHNLTDPYGRNGFQPYYLDSEGFTWQLGHGDSYNRAGVPQANVRYLAKVNTKNTDGYLKINDALILTDSDSATLSSSNIWLFTDQYDWQSRVAQRMFLYGCKIYNIDETTLVRDLVPVVRLYDNKPGLYDRVYNVFYTNQGTGDFTYLDNRLNYITAEYIESDGNQYIDTGITWEANKALAYELTQQFTIATEDVGSGHHRCLFGETASGNFKVGTAETSTKGTETGHICKAVWPAAATVTSPATVSYYFDNILIGENYYEDGHYDTRPYFLFACPSWSGDNTGRPPAYFSTTRVYGAKFYRDSTLVRDFVPVIRKIDNKPGLYDNIEHKFYVNQGTGNFTAIPKKALPLEEIQIYENKTLVNKIGEM